MARANDSRIRSSLSRRHALARLGAGLVGLGLALTSVACAPKVYAERTPGFDLESAKTYAWVTEELVLIQFGDAQPNVRTKDNELRVRAAIDRELAARGFTQATHDEAAVLVSFSVGVRIRFRVEGGEGNAVTGAGGPGETQTQGTLNIYMLDRGQETEVWHGSISKWLSKSDDPETVINDAVHKIMAAYPNQAP